MCEHVPMLVHGMGVRRCLFTRQAAARALEEDEDGKYMRMFWTDACGDGAQLKVPRPAH